MRIDDLKTQHQAYSEQSNLDDQQEHQDKRTTQLAPLAPLNPLSRCELEPKLSPLSLWEA